MNTLKDILRSARRRNQTIPLPASPETLTEVINRVDVADAKALVPPSMYFDLCRLHQAVIARLPYAFFRVQHTDDGFRVFWIDSINRCPSFWGTKLTWDEQAALVHILSARILESEGRFSMIPTGFGPFPIGWLMAGEPFVDVLDRSGIVTGACHDEKCEVLLYPDTIRACRQSWLPHVCVFVPDFAVAGAIRQRQPRRSACQPSSAMADSA